MRLPVLLLFSVDTHFGHIIYCGQSSMEQSFMHVISIKSVYDGVHLDEKLLEKLQSLDSEIPFDAEVVSGDDWNYQVIISARLESGTFLLTEIRAMPRPFRAGKDSGNREAV